MGKSEAKTISLRDDKPCKMGIGEITSNGMLSQTLSGQSQLLDRPAQGSTPSDAGDDVKLSASAQAKSMYSSGQSVQQIAASLGTSTQIVSEYLGISTSTEESLIKAAGK